MKNAIVFAFFGAAASVAAHATFQELWVNNVDDDQKCIRLPVSRPGLALPVCHTADRQYRQAIVQ
jgi:hypothetical protein